jgi:hypothetical protein
MPVVERRYTATAVITLLGIPVYTRAAVGSGVVRIEDQPKLRSIQFAAGSFPESAHGLNRFGLIREWTTGNGEYSWFAFMTESAEKTIDEAQKDLQAKGDLACVGSAGIRRHGSVLWRMSRVNVDPRYTWRDIGGLVAEMRNRFVTYPAMEATGPDRVNVQSFLDAVRSAMGEPEQTMRQRFSFNDGLFELQSLKSRDGVWVMMESTIKNLRTGHRTPFRLWYELGLESMPPARFEYQPRPFLRLIFDANERALIPSIPRMDD